MNWTTQKPTLTHECLLLTKTKWAKGDWYSFFRILKVDTGDGFYFGIHDHYGEEWGDYDDLRGV